MADPNLTTPIMVDATPGPAQIQAAIRQAILAAGGVLSALGFAHAAGNVSLALQFVGPISIVVSFVIGQINTRETAKKATIMAHSTSNSIAVVKPQ